MVTGEMIPRSYSLVGIPLISCVGAVYFLGPAGWLFGVAAVALYAIVYATFRDA